MAPQVGLEPTTLRLTAKCSFVGNLIVWRSPQIVGEPSTAMPSDPMPTYSADTTLYDAKSYYIFYYSKLFAELSSVSKLLILLEAAIGIEPMNKGFAVLIAQFHSV